MKFKEIKPGMVIHCPKEEDARMLLEHLGYACAVHLWERFKEESCYKIIDSGMDGGHLQLYLREREYFREEKITEFSDLIEPDENLANKANDLANNLDNQDNDLDNQRDNEMSAVEVAQENSIETVKPITNKACLELWQQEGEEETVHYLFHGSEELLQAYLAENSTDGEKSTEMSAVFGIPDVIAFCKCNAWKYRYRAGSKGDYYEDIKKADWYIDKVMELQERMEKRSGI